jgi:hypothetical protein
VQWVVWWERRRLERLEDELASARADQASLQRRLEAFEVIAAAAGGAQDPVPSGPMPPGLVAAAREQHAQDRPVRIDVAGSEVIAVVGGGGDPREWWNAIWHIAGEHEAAQ